MGSVDRAEQVPGLGDGKAGGLAVGGVVLPAANRLEGIQGSGMAGDQGVEEMPESGQGLVFGYVSLISLPLLTIRPVFGRSLPFVPTTSP